MFSIALLVVYMGVETLIAGKGWEHFLFKLRLLQDQKLTLVLNFSGTYDLLRSGPN